MTICTDKFTKEEEKKGKPIEFTAYIIYDDGVDTHVASPSDWGYIDLIGRTKDFDLMRAYHREGESSVYYIGHWNDGFVESRH